MSFDTGMKEQSESVRTRAGVFVRCEISQRRRARRAVDVTEHYGPTATRQLVTISLRPVALRCVTHAMRAHRRKRQDG